jgi:hypothetical protein
MRGIAIFDLGGVQQHLVRQVELAVRGKAGS